MDETERIARAIFNYQETFGYARNPLRTWDELPTVLIEHYRGMASVAIREVRNP